MPSSERGYQVGVRSAEEATVSVAAVACHKAVSKETSRLDILTMKFEVDPRNSMPLISKKQSKIKVNFKNQTNNKNKKP